MYIGPSGFGGSGGSSWLGLVGLIDVGCLYFFLFNLIQKYFEMEILSLMIQKNLLIPKSLMV